MASKLITEQIESSSGETDILNDVSITGDLTVSGSITGTFGAITATSVTATGDITSGDQFLAADGSTAAPSYSFTNDPDTGIRSITANWIGFVAGGIELMGIRNADSSIRLPSGGIFGWSSGSVQGGTYDTILARDASGVLAQRNGTNAQALRIYNTYTDGSNYERITISAGASGTTMYQEAAGTGSARNFRIGTAVNNSFGINTNGTSRVEWSGSGHMLWNTDNSLDIGASGANRPRNIYIGSDLVVGGNTTLGTGQEDSIVINADSITLLTSSNTNILNSRGSVATGTQQLLTWTTTAQPADSSSHVVAHSFSTTLSGANDGGVARNLSSSWSLAGSGTITQTRGYGGAIQVTGAGSITTAHGFTSFFSVPGSGSINAAVHFNAESTSGNVGTINTVYGFNVNNIGHSTLINTAYGVVVADLSAAVTARGIQSSLSAGTGRHNLYIDGTAVNYIAAQILAGDSSASAPAYSFNSDSDTGMYRVSSDSLHFAVGGNIGLLIHGSSSAVNYLQISNRGTGVGPVIRSNGTDTNIELEYRTKGNGGHSFYSDDNVTTVRQFRISHVADAVNYVQVQGAATSNYPRIIFTGTDTSVNAEFLTKGAGGFQFSSNSTAGNAIFSVSGLAGSAATRLNIAAGTTGNAPVLSATGSDTNINIALTPKGTGRVTGHRTALAVAVSDETTAITAGTGKISFRMPYAMTLTAVRASLTTAASSGTFTVDINEGGTTILSTKLTIDATETTSTTAATAAVISDTALADDALITVDVDDDAAGDATGLKIYLIGNVA